MAEIEVKEYTEDMQKLYIEFLLSDSELYARCQAIVDPEYFDRKFRKSVKFMQEHISGYSVVPTPDQIFAQTGVKFTLVRDVDERHQDWFLDDFEQFCKHKALANAILSSTDLLEENQFGAVEKMIKDAVQVSLAKNLGTDYYVDPGERLRNLKTLNGGTSTGWESMDAKLFGGFNKGELNIFAGGSGAGLANIGFFLIIGLFAAFLIENSLWAAAADSAATGMAAAAAAGDPNVAGPAGVSIGATLFVASQGVGTIGTITGFLGFVLIGLGMIIQKNWNIIVPILLIITGLLGTVGTSVIGYDGDAMFFVWISMMITIVVTGVFTCLREE
jgi:hypothetical protein